MSASSVSCGLALFAAVDEAMILRGCQLAGLANRLASRRDAATWGRLSETPVSPLGQRWLHKPSPRLLCAKVFDDRIQYVVQALSRLKGNQAVCQADIGYASLHILESFDVRLGVGDVDDLGC